MTTAFTVLVGAFLAAHVATTSTYREDVAWNEELGPVLLHAGRHGLDGVVARMADDGNAVFESNEFDRDSLDGVACAEVDIEESDVEVVALIDELLEAGARAVVLSSTWSTAHVDISSETLDDYQVDPDAPFTQLLQTEPRVVGQEPAFTVELGDVTPGSVQPVQFPYPEMPRPPTGIAPVEFYPTLESSPRVPLVVTAPDGTLRPTAILATWMLVEGIDGPVSVGADAVRIGDVDLAADHGWIRILPPTFRSLDSYGLAALLSPFCPLVPTWGLERGFDTRVAPPDSLADVGDEVAPSDRVVLLMPTAGFDDPFAGEEAGLLVLGTQLLQTGDRARAGSVVLTVVLMLLSTLGVAFVARTESWWAGLGALGIAVFALGGVVAGTYHFGPAFNLLPVLLAVVPAYVVASWLRVRAQRRRTGELERLVSQYVPRELMGELLPDSGGALATGEREATVVFCDLRSFTPVAASLDPADVQRLLEVFYRHVGERVRAAGGTLVQYVGDEVFATFGPPAVVADHADRALECATALRGDSDAFLAELEEAALPPIHYGVGLHSGQIVTAEVGDETHRQYSVIGDAVNIGSRLTTAAGPGEVLFSGDLLSRVTNQPESEQLVEVKLKGVARPLQVYRLS